MTASAGLVEGKVALVTGAASGNGRASALALARHGAAAVVVVDVQESPRENGKPTHELVATETDAEAAFVHCDLSLVPDGDSAAAVVAAGERFGGFDILVNNAGVYWVEDFFDVSPERYDRMMDINVRGTFFLTQAVTRGMAERGSGCVVNVTSGAGSIGSSRRSTYCASKGALQILTYALAAELGPKGIRVNAVSPGTIRTAMLTLDFPSLVGDGAAEQASRIPLRRVGEPDDVANAILYLCSDLAGFVNGTSFEVDGGALRAVNLDQQ